MFISNRECLSYSYQFQKYSSPEDIVYYILDVSRICDKMNSYFKMWVFG